MTLVIALSRPEGIYLSADYRLSDYRTQEALSAAEIKLLGVSFAADRGGPEMALGYSGLATVPIPERIYTGQWLRETLRGEPRESINDALMHLHNRLNRDFAKAKHGLQIVILIMHGDRRWLGWFSNQVEGGQTSPIFGYHQEEIFVSQVLAMGTGMYRFHKDGHDKRIAELFNVAIDDPKNVLKQLSDVTERIARWVPSVGPFAQGLFVPGDSRFGRQGSDSRLPDTPDPVVMPWIRDGMDLIELSLYLGALRQSTVKGVRPPDWDPEACFKRRA